MRVFRACSRFLSRLEGVRQGGRSRRRQWTPRDGTFLFSPAAVGTTRSFNHSTIQPVCKICYSLIPSTKLFCKYAILCPQNVRGAGTYLFIYSTALVYDFFCVLYSNDIICIHILVMRRGQGHVGVSAIEDIICPAKQLNLSSPSRVICYFNNRTAWTLYVHSQRKLLKLRMRKTGQTVVHIM